MFREFGNPEEEDYDLKMSYDDSERLPMYDSTYDDQLMDLIGILEDVTDEDLQNQYGISMEEYLHPNAETIEKVKKALGLESGKHR